MRPPSKFKDALGKLFMKIHPDLLWASPEKRATNERSMQGLNEILAWEKQVRHGVLQPPPLTKAVRFFCREDTEKVIEAKFDLPKGFKVEPSSLSTASSAVNDFLNTLLRRAEVLNVDSAAALSETEQKLKEWRQVSQQRSPKDGAGLKVDPSDVSRKYDASSGWAQRREEARFLRKFQAMGDFGAAFDGQDMEVPEGAHEASELPDPIMGSRDLKVSVQPQERVTKQPRRAILSHLADDFNAMMKEFWKPEDVPEVTELIAADLIHYSHKLSPVDCAKAIHTLREHLPSLRYDRWYFVPLYITDRFGVETDLEGFLSIPYWFEPIDFLKYLDENVDAVRAIQERTFEEAKGLEGLIKKVRESIPLNDIVVRCEHANVRGAVERLGLCASLMQSHNCVDLVVELVESKWQFGARETGILQLPSDFTEEGLKEFLEYLTSTQQLDMIKEAYQKTVSQLNELDRLLRVCYEVIGPHMIDTETAQGSFEDRLMFVKELYSISGELSRYDWSDYTFIMGELDLDWGSGQLSLPPNFHGQNFARTVHMLHEEDQAELGEKENTPDPEQLALDLEARRIRQELMRTGLLELDPQKQTEAQGTLLKMVESNESDENLQRFIKESFPHYAERQQAEAATQQELLAQVRLKHDGYTQKKLRRYFANRHRPRIGPNSKHWDLL